VRLRSCHDHTALWSMAWFPLVGALAGAAGIGAGAFSSMMGVAHPWSAVLIAAALFFVTGGLHLDGLSDTADAFFSRRDREGMLAIMRDPHAGALGTSTVIFFVLVQVAMLVSLRPEVLPAAVVGMCAVSRWVMALAMAVFPYARPQGKASLFYRGSRRGPCAFAGCIALALSFLLGGIPGIVIASAVTAFSMVLAWMFARRLGGITGDVLGALNEIAQLLALAAVVAWQRGIYG
jgi:adenosylcobinamide-GDP ribazoletransferase